MVASQRSLNKVNFFVPGKKPVVNKETQEVNQLDPTDIDRRFWPNIEVEKEEKRKQEQQQGNRNKKYGVSQKNLIYWYGEW